MIPRAPISPAIVTHHAARLSAALARAGHHGYLLFSPSNILGFCGVPLGPSDRLVCALMNRHGAAALVVPAFESSIVDGLLSRVEIFPWQEHEDPYAAVARAANYLEIDAGAILLDRNTWIHVRDRIQQSLGRATLITDDGLLDRIRAVKSKEEMDAIRRACAHCALVFERAQSVVRPATTEDHLYRQLVDHLVTEGAHAEIVLVQSGPNAAVPHRLTGHRAIEPGDAVVIDCVCRRDGYCGDVTRTYFVGHPIDTVREACDAVRQAHDAAIDMIRPGVTAHEVDATARDLIERAGFGGAFLHRLGHGIGLEGHEPPFIVRGSDVVLESGMCFTVEPGIYLEDAFGIRLESVVTVTDGGCDILSDRIPLDVVCEPARAAG